MQKPKMNNYEVTSQHIQSNILHTGFTDRILWGVDYERPMTT
jgi:hypothetical protein